jgi:putative copper export protein
MTGFDIALAAAHGILLLLEALAFGTLAVQALAGNRPHGPLLKVAFWGLVIVGPIWIMLQAEEVTEAQGLSAVIAGTSLVLRETWVGHVILWRIAAWLLAALLLRGAPRLALLPAGAALALHGSSGHAAASGDPVLLGSVLAHVLVAAAWIGGLPALWVALKGPNPASLIRRYTWLGLGCVLVIAVTATIQARDLAGGLPGLVGTDYGHLLLVKIMLLSCLLVLAVRNQFVLAPRLAQGISGLRRSVLIETVLGAATLLVASVLSGLAPGAHQQPDWPFAMRPSFDVLTDPDLSSEVYDAIGALCGALLLLLLAVAARRVRWAAVATAAVITWFAVPHLDLLLIPAEPTVFWSSTTGYTPQSIAEGKAAFAANCAACHGATGHGDGPAAAGMRIPPADLTAPHLWEHPDGELFWWISHGMAGPDGSQVMPGFAGTLDEDTRWALIDFIHANNPNGQATAGGAHHHH